MSLLDDINALVPDASNIPSNTVQSPAKYAAIDADAERTYSLPPGMLSAIGHIESGHNPNAVHRNSNGTVDQGRFQINSVNKGYDGNNPYDAAKILASNLQASNGDVQKAVAMYNVGQHGDLNSRAAQTYIAKYNNTIAPIAAPEAIPPQTAITNPQPKYTGMAADMDALMNPSSDTTGLQQTPMVTSNPKPTQPTETPQDQGAFSNFTSGAKAGFMSPILATKQAYDSGVASLGNLPVVGGAINAIDQLGQKYLGMGSAQQVLNATNQRVAQNQADLRRAQGTTAGTIGSFAGQAAGLAPIMMVPGANELAPAVALGGATGLAATPGTIPERAMGGALGMAGGAIGSAVGSGLSQLGQAYAQKAATNAATQSSLTAPRNAVLERAAQNGYKFSPADINPGGGSLLSGLGNKDLINQFAAANNQKITNSLARQDLGVPTETPLNFDTLSAIRKAAGAHYEEMGNVGTINAGPEYQNAIQNIIDKYSGKLSSFPGSKLNNIEDVLAPYNRPTFNSNDALRASNQLRDMADSAFNTGDNLTGKAYKEASTALENSIGDQLQANGNTQAYKNFQDARRLIAKTYTYQNALNPATGDVDAIKMAGMLRKGTPLTGPGKDIAQTALSFPKSMVNLKTQPVGVGNAEYMAGTLGGLVGGAAGGPMGVAAAALPFGRAAARGVALSSPYQALQRGLATNDYVGSLIRNGANTVGQNPEAMMTLGRLGTAVGTRNAVQNTEGD